MLIDFLNDKPPDAKIVTYAGTGETREVIKLDYGFK
jgi:hypothetical protein